MSIKFTKNFSDTTILRGKTTSFYRIQKEDTGNFNFWFIPEVIEGNCDELLINGIKFSEYIEDLEVLEVSESIYNIFGVPQSSELWDEYGGSTNFDITGPRNITGGIGIKQLNWLEQDRLSNMTNNTKEVTIRIDYYGENDCILRLNVLFARVGTYSGNIVDNLPTLGSGGLIGYTDTGSPISNSVWNWSGNSPVGNIDIFPVGYFPTIGELQDAGLLKGDLDDPEIYLIQANVICKKLDDSLFKRDISHVMDKEILDGERDKKSYMLLKTNPKLTGNIKLMVDSNSKLFLESMDATPELSQDKYKKRPVNQFSDYPSDIKRYFGDLNSEILFSVFNKNDDYTTTKFSLFEQYDNFYSLGTSQLDSKYYDEEMSIFAPLWIKSALPEFFVILKTPGSLNLDSYNGLEYKDIMKKILEESFIIKTYDLRRGSELGNYIRKINEDPQWRQDPLRVVFDQNELSTWSGVSYKEGIITERGEFLHDFFREDNPINRFEQVITGGYERNGIISTNLINLEFLFTDETSELYEINRYFGLYVDMVTMSELNLDPVKLLDIIDQNPKPIIQRDLREFSVTSFFQSNPNGIQLPVNMVDKELPVGMTKDERFFTVIDRENHIWRVKELADNNITLYNTYMDMSKFTGSSNISSQIEACELKPSFSQLEINIVESEGDSIKQGEIFIIEEDIPLGVKWILIANNNKLSPGESWIFPVYNNLDNTYTNTFSVGGTPNDIAKAMSSCMNSFQDRSFISYVKDNVIYAKNTSGIPLKFTRKFVLGSNINTIGFFNKFPLRTFDSYKLFHNTGGNTQISLAALNLPIVTKFRVELTQIISGDVGEFKLFRNDGHIKTFFKNLDENFTYVYKNITIDYVYDGIPAPLTQWQFITAEESIGFKFVGDSQSIGNRVVILKNDIDKINPESWFQWQKNNFSKLEQWDVFGNTVFNINYLEKPIYENGELIGYEDLEKYAILQLPNNHKFSISNEGRMAAFVSYFPNFGILSVSDVKIFDTDWVDSDYSRTPVGELFGMYEKIIIGEEMISLDNNQSFKVIKGEGELWGQRLDDNQWEVIENIYADDYFNTFSMNYIFTDDVWIPDTWEENKLTSPNFYQKVYKKFSVSSVSVDNLELVKNLYYEDPVMRQFNGFLGISDFTSIEDEISFNNLLAEYNVDRFFLGQLKSEYDRLRENFNKEFAIKSKVVPTFLKWSMDFKDCRDNPYRLNNSLAFGINGFSPDPDIAQANSQLHTHEFLYIDSLPKDFDSGFAPSSRGLFFDDISEKKFLVEGENRSWYDLFKLTTSIDYFTKYFTIGTPTELFGNDIIQIPKQRRYEITKFIPGVDEVQCIFRGSRLSFNEFNEDGNVIKGSRKWEGYKFSTILRFLPIPIDGIFKTFNSEFIINERHKTILFAVTVYLNDYRLSGGEWGYTNLYCSRSSFRLRSSVDEPGNWRYLQEYTDIKLNNYITDVILDGTDIIVSLIRDNDNIKLVNHGQFGLGPYFQDAEVANNGVFTQSPNQGTFSSLNHFYKFTQSKYMENINMRHDDIDIFQDKQNFKVKRDNFSRTFFLNKTYEFSNTTATGTRIALVSENEYLGQFAEPDLWYMDGGELYLQDIINKLSFANIKLIMGSLDNGLQVLYKKSNRIQKVSRYLPVDDLDKPDIYTNISIIGFNLEKTNESEIIYRYNGFYNPKTRDIIRFNMRENADLIDYFGLDLINTNTTINLDMGGNSIIPNLWYNKVSDSNLSKLGQGSKYQSLYPLINEININHKDYGIWNGNWDNDYFTFYKSTTLGEPLSGLNEMLNLKSYMGSKAMKVPESFSLDEFMEDEYEFVVEENITNDIKSGTPTTQIVSIRLFVDKIIRRYLLDNGAESEWIRLNDLGILEKVYGYIFNEDQIREITTEYINLNILKLYRVTQIFLWTKASTTIEFFDDLSREQKISNGFRTVDTKVLKENDNNYILTNNINLDNIQSFSTEIYIKRI